MKLKKAPMPNRKRAIVSGKIATIYEGRRLVRVYESGQPLVGEIPQDNLPPFTGYVRGFNKGKATL